MAGVLLLVFSCSGVSCGFVLYFSWWGRVCYVFVIGRGRPVRLRQAAFSHLQIANGSCHIMLLAPHESSFVVVLLLCFVLWVGLVCCVWLAECFSLATADQCVSGKLFFSSLQVSIVSSCVMHLASHSSSLVFCLLVVLYWFVWFVLFGVLVWLAWFGVCHLSLGWQLNSNCPSDK